MEKEAQRSLHILLAEDDEDTLGAIAAFLRSSQRPLCEVVGTVTDGIELVNATVKLAPDVAVVDIMMPRLNGVDAVARLKSLNCNTKVVILTMHRGPEFVRAAFVAGAVGYVLKHRVIQDLPVAIEHALRGERFLSPSLDPAA